MSKHLWLKKVKYSSYFEINSILENCYLNFIAYFIFFQVWHNFFQNWLKFFQDFIEVFSFWMLNDVIDQMKQRQALISFH